MYLSTIRHAVVVAALLAAPAAAHGHRGGPRFHFPGCVEDCLPSRYCGEHNPSCLCIAARSKWLQQGVQCMYDECSESSFSVDHDFLGQLTSVCEAVGHPVPHSQLEYAEGVASSIVDAGDPEPTPTGQPSNESVAETAVSTPMQTQGSATKESRAENPEETTMAKPQPSTTDWEDLPVPTDDTGDDDSGDDDNGDVNSIPFVDDPDTSSSYHLRANILLSLLLASVIASLN